VFFLFFTKFFIHFFFPPFLFCKGSPRTIPGLKRQDRVLGPLVDPQPPHEGLLVKAAILHGLLDTNVKDGLGRDLASLGAVKKPHLLVEDEVRVTHHGVALRHQALELLVAVQKALELLVGDHKGLGVAKIVAGATVFSLEDEALEDLPPLGSELLDALHHVLVDIVAVDDAVELEHDVVFTAPLADLQHLLAVVPLIPLLPGGPADLLVGLVVERVTRDRQDVEVCP